MPYNPRDAIRAIDFSTVISIVNPSTSFSVEAEVNGTSLVFMLDTGSAVTILQKDV